METRRTVLITGGGQGIGFGLAARFHARGDRVLVTGRNPDRLDRAARALPGIETLVNDLAWPAERERLVAHVAAAMPGLDLVVNNAGIQRRVSLAADHDGWPERQEEIDILLAAPVHLNQLLIPVLVKHGEPSRIVNVTSGGAFVPQPFAPVYSACKAALHSYTMNLRHALAATAVGVTELVPPAVATGLAGVASPHGARVDDFCDAAVAGIDVGNDVVGFGPTASAEFSARLAAEEAMFLANVGRFTVDAYAGGTD
jgi:uncharacterized oxidoreductase